MKSTTLLKLMLGAAYTLPLMTSYSTPASAGVNPDPGMVITKGGVKCTLKKGYKGHFDGLTGVLTYPSGDIAALKVCPGGVVEHPGRDVIKRK